MTTESSWMDEPVTVERMWSKPEWTSTLAWWGIQDTGVRPAKCTVDGCGEPRRGGASNECVVHAAEVKRIRAERRAAA